MKEQEKIRILHSIPLKPWFWIGGATDTSPKMVDMTSSLEKFIVPGNTISLSLLIEVNPYIVRWRYLHPITLEEHDFPTKGITIKDGSARI